jgi:prepilin-type processing-associated H-X9-DG protein
MSSDVPAGVPRRRTPTWVLIAVILGSIAVILLFMVLVLGALLLPAVQAAREAARRNMCTNNLRQIWIALQHYHDEQNSFPPAYVVDDKGEPMHSWRVLVLPYLEEPEAQAVYDQYDFDEPWNGPNNIKLADQIPLVYCCPSSDAPLNETSYVAVVGPETAWPGASSTTIDDITDGLSNTIAVVEATQAGIPWLEPRDLTVEQALEGINPPETQTAISSEHRGGANALYLDGSVHFLFDDTDSQTLRAQMSVDGGADADPVVD